MLALFVSNLFRVNVWCPLSFHCIKLNFFLNDTTDMEMEVCVWTNWDTDEVEKQMSPSWWNPTKSSEEVIQEYIDVCGNATRKAIDTVPHQLNISYGPLETHRFDLYGTQLPENAPIFVYIHGGYWIEGSKDLAGGYAMLNNEAGMKTVALGYTLAPSAKIGEIQDEVITALEKLVQMFPKAKLIMAGHSAGGQLAAHLLHKPSRSPCPEFYSQLAGLILISGVYDLRPLVGMPSLNCHLKMNMAEAESLSSLVSPIINPELNRETLKILLIVGEMDPPEFKRQSEQYYEKLKLDFNEAEYWKSDSDDHFTLVQGMAMSGTPCANKVQNFLSKLLR